MARPGARSPSLSDCGEIGTGVQAQAAVAFGEKGVSKSKRTLAAILVPAARDHVVGSPAYC